MKKFILICASIALLLLFTSASADTSLSISWSLTDSKIRPGGTTTVLLTLTNPSSSDNIGSIALTITTGPYLSVSSTYHEYDSLSGSASQQTSFYVTADSSAPSTNSYVKVSASYFSGSKKDVSVNIPIPIRRVPLLQVSDVLYDKTTIPPGSTTLLSFNLVNNGDGAAKDITIVLNQTKKEFIAISSEDYFISSLEPGKKASVGYRLTVSPSTAIGTYSVPITLTYYDELKNTTYSSTKNIGLVISGGYDFIIVRESQTVVAPNKEGSVSLQIANAGNQEALYLIAKVLPSDPLIQITPSEVYIGNLESDEYDLEEFKFKVSESALPGNYPLNLELKYKDSYDQTYNENYSANIKVSSAEEFSAATRKDTSLLTIALIAFVVLVFLFFVYKQFRKKR